MSDFFFPFLMFPRLGRKPYLLIILLVAATCHVPVPVALFFFFFLTRPSGCSLLADHSPPACPSRPLASFRANCLFRNFEIKGPADRLLIYLILFISDCLSKLAPSSGGRSSPTYPEAIKMLSTASVDHFALPGEAGFPLNSLFHGPRDRSEAGE